ncbi:flagellar protein FlgN [Falsibacillus pallidus]|uniref:flagellar protein FlgN n=1 Tax=Falsibacillus pallidus TaxID=493781 RepID=UPI003D960E5A
MSIQLSIIEFMEKLIKLHGSLHQLAKKKTDVIKVGDIETLTQLMKDEQKHVKAIEMLNGKLVDICEEAAPGRTLTEIINSLDEKDRSQLIELQKQLTGEAQKLKDVNDLNQELLEQSLQYIWLNLDLFSGDILSPQYSKSLTDQEESPSASIFESKA